MNDDMHKSYTGKGRQQIYTNITKCGSWHDTILTKTEANKKEG